MKSIVALFIAMLAISCKAQDIALPAPQLDKGLNIMEALNQRHSTRQYAPEELTAQELSNILWATIGINRPDVHKLTSPTAMNRQEIRLFAFFPKGVYEYIPDTHSLKFIAEGDYRPAVAASQAFVKEAPLCLVYVADMEKFGSTDEHAMTVSSIDAGIATENTCIAAAGLGLAIVPRAIMDSAKIREILNLSDKQIPLMNAPIGHFVTKK